MFTLFLSSTRVNHAKYVFHSFHRGFVSPFVIINEGKDEVLFDHISVNNVVNDYFASNLKNSDYDIETIFTKTSDGEKLTLNFTSRIIFTYTYKDTMTYTITKTG
jgi:hypothetical protein